jgi:sugar phosphate isomerase/epimerase
MNRRSFLATIPALLAARHALAASGTTPGRLGVCTFSCHRAWLAARDKSAVVPFADGPTFYDYVRGLGADGAQTGVTTLDDTAATRLRVHVEKTGGYYEGDLRLPSKDSELEKFEHDVRLTRLAGATVARTVLSGSRRYETWKTLAAFTAFRAESSQRLARVDPILKKHGLKLAVENHKDLTSAEFVALLREFNSEWLGVTVDTGNNLALLEDPYATVEALAPFALSVHLKDMAVQPHARGFLLSEVNCGQGFLDLPRIATTLRKANPQVCFNLEMATRDPLLIPCRDDGYFATFPDRKATHLAAALQRVQAHPLKQTPPSITGLPMAKQVADEEANNRACLQWMRRNLA